ncbi:hypothetical protein DFH07DRAFT_1067207 [Mycena maculata]|uniref:Uncharacterized protein n=1 Tax=Mycena maculata TaxID=230809 RepID=A0AAD7HLI7_9AGAR|nr:hypothetical protein DFH07DRAFT_1067207 [Mycena maculata]
MASTRVSWSSRVLSTDSEKTLVEVQKYSRWTRQKAENLPNTRNSDGAGVTPNPTSPTSTTKPNLYQTKRGPLRRAARSIGQAIQRASSAVMCPDNRHTSLRARAGGLRVRDPTYAVELRAMIQDVVRRKVQEEEEEERLRGLLNGRVVGGASKFGRVKLRSAGGNRMDASADWMRTAQWC